MAANARRDRLHAESIRGPIHAKAWRIANVGINRHQWQATKTSTLYRRRTFAPSRITTSVLSTFTPWGLSDSLRARPSRASALETTSMAVSPLSKNSSSFLKDGTAKPWGAYNSAKYWNLISAQCSTSSSFSTFERPTNLRSGTLYTEGREGGATFTAHCRKG